MKLTRTRYGNVNHRSYGNEPAGLVALHGFTQHGGSFEELAAYLDVGLLAVDLPGHGATDVQPATFEVAVEVVSTVLEAQASPPVLLGYSQGGRISLQVALRRSDLIDRLILISASPGIADPRVREERRDADRALATHIEEAGVATFIDEWLAMDMFAGLRDRPAEWRVSDRNRRLENTAQGLAAGLRGMGPGAQPYLGDNLRNLTVPLLAVAGGTDRKYSKCAEMMAGAAPGGTVEIVPRAGHAVIGESPEALAVLINRWIADGAVER